METTPKTQSVELIKASNNILLLAHIDPDGDAIGSILALRAALMKIGKTVDAVIPDKLDQTYSFLKDYEQIKDSIDGGKDLVITIDTKETGEDLKLGWKRFADEHRVKIVITPPKAKIKESDVRIESAQPKYDLVILLDCSSLDRVGKLSEEYPELFDANTISIDHHLTNSFFAKVNWVDLTATATAEMLVSLIESLGRDEPILDETIATDLLTGLIIDTGSFQNPNTTSKSLTVAAQLVAAGANHQQIVEKISTHNLATLKLWGKALTRVTEEHFERFLWTYVTSKDVEEVGESASSSGLIDELLKTVGEVDFVMLLSQKEEYVNVNLRSVDKEYDVSLLAQKMGGGGHQVSSGFQLPGSLDDQKDDIIEQVKNYQRSRLNLPPVENGKDKDNKVIEETTPLKPQD